MALPDPELELLLEVLEEEPGADVFPLVGRELMVRGRWAEAADILAKGLQENPEETEGWALLAESALQAGRYKLALEALDHVEIDVDKDTQLARLQVLAFEATAQMDRARACADRFLASYPDDVVVRSVRERLDAPPPDPRCRAADPLVSVERAESYVALGRADRAIRIYRLLLYAHKEEPSLQGRLAELRGKPFLPVDDLSEELTAETARPKGPPPNLAMPTPLLGLVPEGTVSQAAFYDDVTDPKVDMADVHKALKEHGKGVPRPRDDEAVSAAEEAYSEWDDDDAEDDDEPTAVREVGKGSPAKDEKARGKGAGRKR